MFGELWAQLRNEVKFDEYSELCSAKQMSAQSSTGLRTTSKLEFKLRIIQRSILWLDRNHRASNIIWRPKGTERVKDINKLHTKYDTDAGGSWGWNNADAINPATLVRFLWMELIEI